MPVPKAFTTEVLCIFLVFSIPGTCLIRQNPLPYAIGCPSRTVTFCHPVWIVCISHKYLPSGIGWPLWITEFTLQHRLVCTNHGNFVFRLRMAFIKKIWASASADFYQSRKLSFSVALPVLITKVFSSSSIDLCESGKFVLKYHLAFMNYQTTQFHTTFAYFIPSVSNNLSDTWFWETWSSTTCSFVRVSDQVHRSTEQTREYFISYAWSSKFLESQSNDNSLRK